jgi:ABC-type sulfate transport system permease subunit
LEPLGIQVAYTPIGITLALIFIGLPFVVRTVQPVLSDIETELKKQLLHLVQIAGRPLQNHFTNFISSTINRLCFGICSWCW